MYTEHFFVYYSEGRYSEARAATQVAEECWEAVRREFGFSPTRRVRLYLAGSQTELEALCGGPEDFRLAGRARPGESTIIVHLQGAALARRAVLAHELVHIALGHALAPHGVEPPKWLTEGLSEYVADAVTEGDQRRRARGQPMPMANLHVAFPNQPQQSNLAYAQSRSFVEFVIQQTGDKGLNRLVHALAETGDIHQAFVRAYGRPMADFEAAWRPQFAKGLGRALPVNVDIAIFMAMSALFVLVCVVRVVRARRRRAAEELGIEEDEAEYWDFKDHP